MAESVLKDSLTTLAQGLKFNYDSKFTNVQTQLDNSQSEIDDLKDKIVETYDNLTSFPSEGVEGRVYIARDTNKTYRWTSDDEYVEVGGGLPLFDETDNNKFLQINDDASGLQWSNVTIPQEVQEYDSLDDFPEEGVANTIYIAKDTNKAYRFRAKKVINSDYVIQEGDEFEFDTTKNLDDFILSLSTSSTTNLITLTNDNNQLVYHLGYSDADRYPLFFYFSDTGDFGVIYVTTTITDSQLETLQGWYGNTITRGWNIDSIDLSGFVGETIYVNSSYTDKIDFFYVLKKYIEINAIPNEVQVYETKSAFPEEGELSTLYIDEELSKIYHYIKTDTVSKINFNTSYTYSTLSTLFADAGIPIDTYTTIYTFSNGNTLQVYYNSNPNALIRYYYNSGSDYYTIYGDYWRYSYMNINSTISSTSEYAEALEDVFELVYQYDYNQLANNIHEYSNYNNFPLEGISESIYVDKSTNKIYRFLKTSNIDLNNQFVRSTYIDTYQDLPVYESVNPGDSGMSVATITIKDVSSYTIYIRSEAESTWDYTVAFALDTEATYSGTGVINTKGYQSQWRSYTYTNISSGEHFIQIMYRKDSSGATSPDKGFFCALEVTSCEYIELCNPIHNCSTLPTTGILEDIYINTSTNDIYRCVNTNYINTITFNSSLSSSTVNTVLANSGLSSSTWTQIVSFTSGSYISAYYDANTVNNNIIRFYFSGGYSNIYYGSTWQNTTFNINNTISSSTTYWENLSSLYTINYTQEWKKLGNNVLSYDNQSGFPTTGSENIVYIAKDTNKTYRWTGSAYVEIGGGLPTVSTGDTGSVLEVNSSGVWATSTYKKADLVDGKVPTSQLPSYVDDVIEGYYYNGSFYSDSSHTQIITPESGKIYVDLTTNKTYRWSGSVYVEISASLVLGTTHENAYYGDLGNTAYQHSQVTTGNPHNVTASEVGIEANPTTTTASLSSIKIGDTSYKVSALPEVTTTDEGKVLEVNSSGAWSTSTSTKQNTVQIFYLG